MVHRIIQDCPSGYLIIVHKCHLTSFMHCQPKFSFVTGLSWVGCLIISFFLFIAQSDELSFKEGDTIVDIDKFDDAWWSGRIGNRVGIFPSNRVQETTAGAAASFSGATGFQQKLVSSITAMALYDFAACKFLLQC